MYNCKKTYEKASFLIVRFGEEDVIKTSNGSDGFFGEEQPLSFPFTNQNL